MTELSFDYQTKITKIKITDTGYEDGSLEDHTIAAEVTGEENKKTITLTKKKVIDDSSVFLSSKIDFVCSTTFK